MISVARGIWLDEGELAWEFIRAGGPGGQHVNKASTAVQLRFSVDASATLPGAVKLRLKSLAGSSLTKDGELIITARGHRSQERNRTEAIERLVELVARAASPPRPRTKTRPTTSSRERRLKAKSKRGVVKKMRRKGGEDD